MPMASLRHDQPLFLDIPNGNPEHAIEMIENVGPPLFVAVDDNFRVRVRAKAVAVRFSTPAAVLCNCRSRH